MMRRRILAAACSCMLIFAGLAGCAEQAADSSSSTSSAASQAEASVPSSEAEPSAQAAGTEPEAAQGVVLPYSETAQEQYGLPAELRLETTPERIIVMTLGPTEILHELGVELLAVPDTIDESQAWTQDLEAERLPFSANSMDTEGIIAMEPDLIIMSAGKRETYGTFFEEKDIPVYYTCLLYTSDAADE